MNAQRANPFVAYMSLFTATGTLLCCALPSLLVFIGLGATVASFLAATPWLVALSRHKPLVFGISGALILVSLLYVYRWAPRLTAWGGPGEVCPADDPTCGVVRGASRVILWLSAGIWLIGFFAAFALGPLLVRFAS